MVDPKRRANFKFRILVATFSIVSKMANFKCTIYSIKLIKNRTFQKYYNVLILPIVNFNRVTNKLVNFRVQMQDPVEQGTTNNYTL